MGFKLTTFHDLVGCSNHWATGDSMVSKKPLYSENNGGYDFSEYTFLPEFTLNVMLLFLR